MKDTHISGGSYVRQEDGSLKLVQRTEAADQAKASRSEITATTAAILGKPGSSKGK
ncbi:MAG: hypothetical protein K0M55_07970 [Rhizobium sp.]|nr:hypothetical protein [Rhizobium sp.]MBW8320118.1 hypothetical protein [Rhizobium sp.]